MTTATHRNDPSALLSVKAFDYLGFACRFGFDRETRDWLMEIDGQPIGYARSEDAARSAIETHCEEVERHTRATTADMAAEQAEMQADADAYPAPPATLDAFLATMTSGQGTTDAAITARIPTPACCAEWDAAQVKVEKAYAALTLWPERPPQSPDDIPADVQLFTCDPCHELRSSAELTPDDGDDITICLTCADGLLAALPTDDDQQPIIRSVTIVADIPRCPSCGGIAAGVCSACWESGEQELRDAMYSGSVTATRRPDYAALGDDPERTADDRVISGDDDFALTSAFVEAELAACRNYGGAHHIQACGEVRDALLASEPTEKERNEYDQDQDRDRGADDLTAIDRMALTYDAHTGGGLLLGTAAGAPSDPCAEVRARLERAIMLLQAVEALVDASGTVDTETHAQIRAFLGKD